MPPKPAASPTAQLPLQDWLKLLSGRGVDMRVSMQLAAKIYKSHGTIQRLSELTPQKLATLIDDKDARKTVHNAVRGLAAGETVSKKRERDSDLLRPLGKKRMDEEDVPLDMEFHPVTDIEELLPLTLTTNRSPVKTAWAYTLALKMGFDHLESLSIAHTYVHISSLKHALKLGNILDGERTREAEQELSELPGAEKESWGRKRDDGRAGRWRGGKERHLEERPAGSAQPWVGLMGHKPIIERPDGTCRAIEQGEPVGPSQAYLYITRTFKHNTSHVMGAMRIVADSYPPDELNRLASHMYNEFKPDVVEWGQRGTLELAKVLDQARGPVEECGPATPVSAGGASGDPDGLDGDYSTIGDVKQQLDGASPTKKAGAMTVEEYEAMLDAENEEGEGGFLEGGDVVKV